MMVLVIMFISSMQPIFMVSVVILVTLFYSLYIFEVVGSYWYSYILMMIMMSGVLVVFTYMVSLMPNEKFEMYDLLLFSLFVYLMISEGFKLFESDLSYITVNMWESYLSMFIVFLVVFLLGLMLMVVWMSYLSEGAIRVGE